MEILLCSLLFMVVLQSCVVCGGYCGVEIENVSGGEGGDVILQVPQMGIRFIIWALPGNVIVRTKPEESIVDNNLTEQYRGRVRSEDDGSLHIYRLSPQDQSWYPTIIQTTEDKRICVLFNLNVYEILSPGDIQINHTITRNDPCSLDLFCSVDKRNVTITWSSVHTSDINVTRGVLYVSPRGVNVTYICTARNPVSNVSKTVIPGEYCSTEKKREPDGITGDRCMIPWILSGIVLLITVCIFIHHMKSEVIQSSGRP
ncbi:signaling lymphocytic activation molecule-like [Hyla sarda]|uniref:signaling lymphocytic activation molecule-like n=1 Tax=Hyla sarda TaxID=327740 RepID=UPI0024C32CA4|nr:signaling lymphocytic activation molecule-like [Hyla sarda]